MLRRRAAGGTLCGVDGTRDVGGEDAGPPLPPDLVVPDDARALAAETSAVRAEMALAALQRRRDQRASRRRQVLGRLVPRPGGPGRRLGDEDDRQRTGRLVLLALVVLGVPLVLLGLLLPRGPVLLGAEPLARDAERTGAVGGLLPDTELVTVGQAGRTVRSREVRPAVLALLPRDCGCDATLASLSDQAAAAGVGLLLVRALDDEATASERVDQGRALRRLGLGTGRPTGLLLDPGGTLADALSADGLTAAVVAPDGRLTGVQRSAGPQTRLDAALADAVPAAA